MMTRRSIKTGSVHARARVDGIYWELMDVDGFYVGFYEQAAAGLTPRDVALKLEEYATLDQIYRGTEAPFHSVPEVTRAVRKIRREIEMGKSK